MATVQRTQSHIASPAPSRFFISFLEHAFLGTRTKDESPPNSFWCLDEWSLRSKVLACRSRSRCHSPVVRYYCVHGSPSKPIHTKRLTWYVLARRYDTCYSGWMKKKKKEKTDIVIISQVIICVFRWRVGETMFTCVMQDVECSVQAIDATSSVGRVL